MDYAPVSPSDYRNAIGKMLTSLHPLYDVVQGTGEQSQYIDLLDNARKQLEATYTQVPGSDDALIPDFVPGLFASAQSAYNVAINAPRTTGFTAAKTFGQQGIEAVTSFAKQAEAGVKAATGIDLGLKVVIGLLIVAGVLGVLYVTRKT